MQILIGGFVGASGAALACPDFPSCGTDYLSGAQEIQMTHRLIAFSLAAALIGIWLLSKRLPAASRVVAARPIFNTMILVFCQIFVGSLNLYYKISPLITVVHIILAQGILNHLILAFQSLRQVGADQADNGAMADENVVASLSNSQQTVIN